MARVIHTEIHIDAPKERVWNVLADFDAHPEWNPFITGIDGEAAAGQMLTVRLRPPGGRAMTFRPKVLAAVPGRELRWVGTLGIPGLFDGEHRFFLEDAGPGRTRFVQEEAFRGALVPLLGRALQRTRAGFELMNSALKGRVEGGS